MQRSLISGIRDAFRVSSGVSRRHRMPHVLRSLCMIALLATPTLAKDPPQSAIVLFDGTDGPAYVQITGVILSGKTEVRLCGGAQKIDRKTWGTLVKMPLKGATLLERNAEGVLMLTADAAPVCVVPGDLKFERQPEFTLSEAADQAMLEGTVVASSARHNGQIPEIKRGVKIVFVAAPDTELAEYLRAQRAHSIAGWQDFLSRYGSSARATEARGSMAALYQTAADSAFARYRQSANARTPDLAQLKLAQQQLEQLENIASGSSAAVKLRNQIHAELEPMVESARTELAAYRKSLADGVKGHAHLRTAKQHNQQALDIDAKYAPALALDPELFSETRKLEVAIQTAEGLVTANRQDEALAGLGQYRAFAPEMPRIEAIVTAAYKYHLERGQEFAAKQNLEKAVAEFKKAVETRADNAEATALLRNAELELKKNIAHQATEDAMRESKAHAEKQEWVEAYEVLASLPEDQRAAVAPDMADLKPKYVPAAIKQAQKLLDVHFPVRGRTDEDAVRKAYELLQRAYALSSDNAVRLKLDLLSDKLGNYYLELARRYLTKPLGSGVGLGWLYLIEARRYNPDLDAVKDEMAQYSGIYQLRARLSIGVIFRDQTSRRESAGFTDQLADAVANGLENFGLPVKVVRKPSESPDAVQPNFLLTGQILEHRIVKNNDLATLQSKYRVGVHEIKNEAWLKIDRDLTAAQQQLADAQRALTDAQTRRKKPEIATATDAVAAAQKQVDELRHKLETTESTRPEAIIEPYNYTKKTLDLTAVTELDFRITDPSGALVAPAVPIKKENHKVFVVLENVKPEDTEGIKPQSAAPDEAQFLTDVEIQARDSVIKTLQERVSHLPEKILQEARKRAAANDLDGAAEQYILYLNATPKGETAERAEAGGWLRERFNLGPE